MNSIIYFNPESGNVSFAKAEGCKPYISAEEWNTREEQYKEELRQRDKEIRIVAETTLGATHVRTLKDSSIRCLALLAIGEGLVPLAMLLLKLKAVVGITLFIIIGGLMVSALVKRSFEHWRLRMICETHHDEIICDVIEFAKRKEEELREKES